MSSKSLTFGKYHAMMVAGALALTAGLAQPAVADAVKLDGQWITQGVTVVRIEDGKIVYSVRGTETEDQLSNLQGMRLDAYPDLAEAQKNLTEGKGADAVPQLKRVITATSQQLWARQYAEKLLLQAYDQSNKPLDLVLIYLKLANDKAPADYLTKPPTSALAKASDAIKKDVRARLTKEMARLPEDAKAGAQLMLKAVGDEAAKPVTPTTPATGTPATPTPTPTTVVPTTPTPSTPATVAPTTPVASSGSTLAPSAPAAAPASATPADPDAPAIPAGLPKNIPVTYEGVKLYREGKYDETLKWVDEQLKTAQQNFSFFFYLRGLALYAIAEKTEDRDMLLDAGVSFMKCAIYFPRDMYAGPAYLETARVYVKLGKLKEAKKLLNKATPMIMEEPGLEEKVEKLTAALKDTGDAPGSGPKDNY
jgi:tetratricopeptide (TPR) repeat protein